MYVEIALMAITMLVLGAIVFALGQTAIVSIEWLLKRSPSMTDFDHEILSDPTLGEAAGVPNLIDLEAQKAEDLRAELEGREPRKVVNQFRPTGVWDPNWNSNSTEVKFEDELEVEVDVDVDVNVEVNDEPPVVFVPQQRDGDDDE